MKFPYKIIAQNSLMMMLCLCFSCEEFTSISPPKTQIVTETVFSDDASAISAMSGIYHEIYQSEGFLSGNSRSIIFLTGFSSDELINYSMNSDVLQFYNNSLISANGIVKGNLWEQGYKLIYYTNSVLDGLSKSRGMTLPIRKQLEGEARFIRALCHFYLVNLFGDIPYVTSIDYRINNSISKISRDQIYVNVLSELNIAKTLLVNDYSMFNEERVRVTKWAASALLARVYLYAEEWENSEVEATQVINNFELYSLENDLDDVFLSNSTEAILQIRPVISGRNTTEANLFILKGVPTTAALSMSVVEAFETGDQRRVNWVDSITINGNVYYYPYKYKQGAGVTSVTEYSMFLRLSEQYLIRAEARAQQQNIDGSRDDLDVIRNRAGLQGILADNREDLLVAIEQERKVELFTENGHRWMDLKRTARADILLKSLKGSDWQNTDVLYPIPLSEIKNNPKLGPNNPGYF